MELTPELARRLREDKPRLVRSFVYEDTPANMRKFLDAASWTDRSIYRKQHIHDGKYRFWYRADTTSGFQGRPHDLIAAIRRNAGLTGKKPHDNYERKQR